jgi:hypothetical protein
VSATDMLDAALDDEDDALQFCPGCGLMIDDGDAWCGVDPACRVVARSILDE